MPRLLGTRLSLLPIDATDAAKWADWLNDLDVALPLGDEAYTPITLAYMRRDLEAASVSAHHVFSVALAESGESVGRCLLFGVDHVNRSAHLGVFIGEKALWGQGYGKEALILLLDYAFNLLNLNSVMLGAFAFNERAIGCYRSVGFREIGRRREARIVAGVAHDSVLLDMLAAEFRERYHSIITP